MAAAEKVESVNLFSLTGKVALITGVSKGIGLALMRGFGEAGAIVYGTVRSPESQAKVSRDLEIELERLFLGDVTDFSFQEGMVRRLIKGHQKIDILVNNAGVTRGNPSEDYALTDWHLTLDTNLTAVFHLCQLVGQEMIKQRQGAIINITSIGSLLGFPDNPAYAASKGGLRMLTKALARDWAGNGIRVNNLCPGYIKTDMTAKSYHDPVKHAERLNRLMIKRFGEPEDLIGPAIFLASDASAYITGIDLVVDGGWTAQGL
jgi:NAD(P)-dependent dehydrogenase (short-subunit alcohol dehydrogenase family)